MEIEENQKDEKLNLKYSERKLLKISDPDQALAIDAARGTAGELNEKNEESVLKMVMDGEIRNLLTMDF